MAVLSKISKRPEKKKVVAPVAPGVKAGPQRANGTSNNQTLHPFVEYPTPPLNDADREYFLALLDADNEPNEALRQAAAQFKQGAS